MVLCVLFGHWSILHRNRFEPRTGISLSNVIPGADTKLDHPIPFQIVNEKDQGDNNVEEATP